MAWFPDIAFQPATPVWYVLCWSQCNVPAIPPWWLCISLILHERMKKLYSSARLSIAAFGQLSNLIPNPGPINVNSKIPVGLSGTIIWPVGPFFALQLCLQTWTHTYFPMQILLMHKCWLWPCKECNCAGTTLENLYLKFFGPDLVYFEINGNLPIECCGHWAGPLCVMMEV